MSENNLHRSLKFHYSGSNGVTEALVGDYVCDAKTGSGEIIEVQTGSFGPLREKAKQLAQTAKVRIIHPIVNQKSIELYDTKGKLLRRRKSPKKGKTWDLFNSLIYAPELPLIKNLCIELAVVDIIEKRIDDGRGPWRRKGISISDRLLGAWHDSVVLKSPKDYLKFIPFNKTESFTVRNLEEKADITMELARKAIYVLKKIGLIKQTGKQGNAIVYKRNLQ